MPDFPMRMRQIHLNPLHKASSSLESYNYFGFTALEITDEIGNVGSPLALPGCLLLLEVNNKGKAEAHGLQGITHRELSDPEWERLGRPPDRLSLATRDIITAIDGIPLQGIQQMNKYVEQVSLTGEEVTLSVWRYRDTREWSRIPMTLGRRQ